MAKWLNKYKDGGKLKSIAPEDAAIANVLMNRNRGKNFVDRAYNNDTALRLQTNQIPGYANMPSNQYSTELMAYDVNPDGTGRVYPEIVQKPGNAGLTYLGGDKAWDYADSTGQYITTPNAKTADMLSNYGYKKATGIPTYKDGGKVTWKPDSTPIVDAVPANGISAADLPTFEGHRNIPQRYVSPDEQEITALRAKQDNTPAIGAKGTWQQKAKNYLKGSDDLLGDVTNIMDYPMTAAINLTQPSNYFQDADGNSQAGFVGAGNMMLDMAAASTLRPSKSHVPAIEPPLHGSGFPHGYTKNNPTGGTGMPYMTEVTPMSAENKIYQSFGIAPKRKNGGSINKKNWLSKY